MPYDGHAENNMGCHHECEQQDQRIPCSEFKGSGFEVRDQCYKTAHPGQGDANQTRRGQAILGKTPTEKSGKRWKEAIHERVVRDVGIQKSATTYDPTPRIPSTPNLAPSAMVSDRNPFQSRQAVTAARNKNPMTIRPLAIDRNVRLLC